MNLFTSLFDVIDIDAFMNIVAHKFSELLNSLAYLKNIRSALALNAWVDISKGEIVNRNWGDDVNYYFLRLISGREIQFACRSLFHKIFLTSNYICIGSILGGYENRRSVIWGAGYISNSKKLRQIPEKICSVRGKYTREILIRQGVDCPESYGDPVLLVSKYYKPIIKNKFRLGIIAHFVDFNNPIVQEYVARHNDCLLINLSEYKEWTDILDQIASCECIISSSLHGLIVSDSYGIKNCWVSFSDNITGGNFKYLDYFSSVDRDETEPIRICKIEDIDVILKAKMFSCSAKINFDMILSSCPFDLLPPKY